MEKNIVIYGGSFNPVHKVHTQIIKKLSKRFDKVIVVPCFASPFKKEVLCDGALRTAMINNVITGLENVEVSDYELARNTTSYSYETAAHFKSLYKNDNLFFAIGAEMLPTLTKWKEFKTLQDTVTFFVIKRDGFEIDKTLTEMLAKKGVKIEISKFKTNDISSSLAKVSLAFNKKDIVGAKNYKLIRQNNLYESYNKYVEAYGLFTLEPERIEHTYRAVVAGINLAKKYDGDIDKTITALLLHDVAKNADENILKANRITLTDEEKSLPAKIKHSAASAAVAKKYFGIKDNDIIKAIAEHTSGSDTMSKLSMIVYLADYIETGRKFDGVDNIRKACDISLEAGMAAALKITITHLEEAGREVYDKSIEAFVKFAEFDTEISGIKQNSFKSALKQQKSEKPAPQRVLKEQINDGYDLAYTIAQFLDDKKGRDIVLINLEGKTIIADYFVIASVSSSTAVKALTDFVDEKLSKLYKIEPLRRDIDAKWAAIDYGSVILHIQVDETRKLYDIQKLWSDGKNVKAFNPKA